MATAAAVAGVAGAVCAEARPVQPQTAAMPTASNILGLVMILPYGFGEHGWGNGGALLDQTSRVNFWRSIALTCAVKYPCEMAGMDGCDLIARTFASSFHAMYANAVQCSLGPVILVQNASLRCFKLRLIALLWCKFTGSRDAARRRKSTSHMGYAKRQRPRAGGKPAAPPPELAGTAFGDRFRAVGSGRKQPRIVRASPLILPHLIAMTACSPGAQSFSGVFRLVLGDRALVALDAGHLSASLGHASAAS